MKVLLTIFQNFPKFFSNYYLLENFQHDLYSPIPLVYKQHLFFTGSQNTQKKKFLKWVLKYTQEIVKDNELALWLIQVLMQKCVPPESHINIEVTHHTNWAQKQNAN